MKDLEQILQQFFNCNKPFRKDGKPTVRGWKAYSKLTELIYALGSLDVLNDANGIVESLDDIIHENVSFDND